MMVSHGQDDLYATTIVRLGRSQPLASVSVRPTPGGQPRSAQIARKQSFALVLLR